MSDCVICGFDMQDANSKAGRSNGIGVNLNSVSVRYMLSQNPEQCRMIYNGQIPSFFGNAPTITDGGTFAVNDDTGESIQLQEGNETSDMMNGNPAVIASQMTGQNLSAHEFTGALAPQYHDNAQPIFHANSMVGMGTNMPIQQPAGMFGYGMQPQFSGIMNNRGPSPNTERNYAKEEWEQYQRTFGFKAPIPTDTDFPGFGLLSGFAKGFDPYQALMPGDDDFYDVTINGRVGSSQRIHQMMLSQYANVWGYVPGQVIDRRENMMFPGINEDHHSSVPSQNPVYNHQGVLQTRIGGYQQPPMMMANQLPVSNMVATNPYMQGISNVGGVPINASTYSTCVPTPYMQARYNYAIANGFQSIQEMDKNDFLILKVISHAAHGDMSDEEFEKHFDRCWCRPFVAVKEFEEDMKRKGDEIMKKASEIPRMKVFLVKGDKILSGMDMFTDEEGYRQHVVNVKNCHHKTDEEYMRDHFATIEREARRDAVMTFLHAVAVERKYDKASFLDFAKHGMSEAGMRDLEFQVWKQMNSPASRQAELMIDQTRFMRNCMERGTGYGIPAAYSRLAMENRMFYVGEELPAEEYRNYLRGKWGANPDGSPLPDMVAPLYGYLNIADPENPTMHIPFPRRHIRDLHEGFVRFANVSAAKSKEPFHIMDYDEFSTALGVRIMDDQEFIDKYKDFEPAQKYVDIAKRGVQMEKDKEEQQRQMQREALQSTEDLNRPPHANCVNDDLMDYENPTADIPFDELLRQVDEDSEFQPPKELLSRNPH